MLGVYGFGTQCQRATHTVATSRGPLGTRRPTGSTFFSVRQPSLQLKEGVGGRPSPAGRPRRAEITPGWEGLVIEL